MRKFVVANPKGGCAKSTMAIHLASRFARCDEVVYLGDKDRQQSSRQWLAQRPKSLARIWPWETGDDTLAARRWLPIQRL